MEKANVNRDGSIRAFARAPYERRQNLPYIPSKAGDQPYTVIVDEFNSAYWSGLDASIYFNDMYIDDIVNIQYQVIENRMPLYELGSYTYNTAVPGVRSIQGNFSINFKRSFYIPLVLKTLKEIEDAPRGSSKKTAERLKGISIPTTIEEILGSAKQKSSQGFDYNILDEIRERNTEKFWDSQDDTVKPNFQRKNFPLFDGGLDGFTIFLKFGQPKIREDEPATFSRKGVPLPLAHVGTVEALVGATISSMGKAVDDSGRNILEVYSFIAKDIETELG